MTIAAVWDVVIYKKSSPYSNAPPFIQGRQLSRYANVPTKYDRFPPSGINLLCPGWRNGLLSVFSSIVTRAMASLPNVLKKFPKVEDCTRNLERLRWNGKPTCPYRECRLFIKEVIPRRNGFARGSTTGLIGRTIALRPARNLPFTTLSAVAALIAA